VPQQRQFTGNAFCPCSGEVQFELALNWDRSLNFGFFYYLYNFQENFAIR